MNRIKVKLAYAAATFCYIGYLKPAPGTWGSLAAVLIAPMLWKAGAAVYLIVTVAVGAAGFWASKVVLENPPSSNANSVKPDDPSFIVIDEAAGILITLFLPLALFQDLVSIPIIALCGFAAFRAFDILKPLNVGWVDKNVKGALGIMLDDAIAGLYAAAVVLLALISVKFM
jgi:phosphatidylglycerophosphatase A